MQIIRHHLVDFRRSSMSRMDATDLLMTSGASSPTKEAIPPMIIYLLSHLVKFTEGKTLTNLNIYRITY